MSTLTPGSVPVEPSRVGQRPLGARLLRPGDRQGVGHRHQAGHQPAVEVARDGDDAVIRVDLPGVDVAEDVHVEVDKQARHPR